jgi:thiamine biosynthesis lipoprotein
VLGRFWSLLRERPPHHATFEPVLGTRLTLTCTPRRTSNDAAAERAVLDEIARLEQCYSAYLDDSELRVWGRDITHVVSTDLANLLALGVQWQQRSGGTFNPAVASLTVRWREAERTGVAPSDDELTMLAGSIAEPRYDERGHHCGDCSQLTFNALAKGVIIDAAARTALSYCDIATVDIGGDLRHVGLGSRTVGVENPLRPFDNEPPIAVVEISNEGLATSGLARRGFRVGDRWFSHVLDPRTGHPVDHVASASVIAPDCATADAVATVLSVLPANKGLAWIAEQPEALACLIIEPDGTQHANPAWNDRLGRSTR